MFCPCCKNGINKLWRWYPFVQCVRKHTFVVRFDGEGRMLELVHTNDQAGKVGQTFTVGDDDVFNQEIELTLEDWQDLNSRQGFNLLMAVREFLEQGDRIYVIDQQTKQKVGRVVRNGAQLELRPL